MATHNSNSIIPPPCADELDSVEIENAQLQQGKTIMKDYNEVVKDCHSECCDREITVKCTSGNHNCIEENANVQPSGIDKSESEGDLSILEKEIDKKEAETIILPTDIDHHQNELSGGQRIHQTLNVDEHQIKNNLNEEISDGDGLSSSFSYNNNEENTCSIFNPACRSGSTSPTYNAEEDKTEDETEDKKNGGHSGCSANKDTFIFNAQEIDQNKAAEISSVIDDNCILAINHLPSEEESNLYQNSLNPVENISSHKLEENLKFTGEEDREVIKDCYDENIEEKGFVMVTSDSENRNCIPEQTNIKSFEIKKNENLNTVVLETEANEMATENGIDSNIMPTNTDLKQTCQQTFGVLDSSLNDDKHKNDDKHNKNDDKYNKKYNLGQEVSDISGVLTSLSLSESINKENAFSLLNSVCGAVSNFVRNEGKEDKFEGVNSGRNSSCCSDDGSLNFNIQEICNKNGATEIAAGIDEENLLGIANELSSEMENNLYQTALGLEDIINAAVSEIGFEFSKENNEGFLSLDSDSNLATASEGVISSCSPSTSSENSQQVSESRASCQVGSLKEMSQASSIEEVQNSIGDRDAYGKRGDADGCSLSIEPSRQVNVPLEADKGLHYDLKLKLEKSVHTKKDDSNSCSCQRPDIQTFEENGSILLGAWNELRSSLRQLYRSVVPSSLAKSGLSNPRNRPSVNRIKALSNMLLAHDPHQLFTRVNQLSQELCIELKVRLLATIYDSPDAEESLAFIKGLCESYEWVINVCETIQMAFDKLDTDYLSRFGLNWMTVNMHTFHATILTDPDVQDYLALCCIMAEESQGGDEALGCLSSLRRTLGVAENVWSRAENHLQEYAIERVALNAQRRQYISNWGSLQSRHLPCRSLSAHKGPSACSSVDKETSEDLHVEENQLHQQCPCTDCHKLGIGSCSPSATKAVSIDSSRESPNSCECHFCNSSNSQSHPSSSVLPASSSSALSVPNSSVLPPLSQPQLSLYPHIHGTSVRSDIVANQGFEDLGPLPSTSKPPVFSNPYLGSDLLTEQLIREWDLAYGDSLTPPGMQPLVSTIPGASLNDSSELVNQLDNLTMNPEGVAGTHSSGERSLATATQDSHSCPHAPQDIPPQKCSQTASVTPSTTNNASIPTQDKVEQTSQNIPKYKKEELQKILLQKQHEKERLQLLLQKQQQQRQQRQQQEGTPTSSVITHTSSCAKSQPPKPSKDQPLPVACAKHDTTLACSRQGLSRSSSQETPSQLDSSDQEEWSSGDESDAMSSGSSTNHKDSHCDCCYCHMLQNKPGGGRQKYSDRRDRLLKILSNKKMNSTSSPTVPSSGAAVSTSPTSTSAAACTQAVSKGEENSIGRQTLDEIMNYIEGKRSSAKCHKKAAKKARQKERKLAMKRQEEKREEDPRYRDDEDDDAYYQEETDEEEEEEEVEEEEEEEEEDGPLAELRRRAPDVTITVVKPGQQRTSMHQTLSSRDHPPYTTSGRHPLVAKPLAPPTPLANSMWNPPRAVLPSGRLSSVPMSPVSKGTLASGFKDPQQQSSTSGTSTGGLSSLLKGMESLNDASGDKDGKSSQMVTIRRVMDPISSEPTVTITLKGEEPKKDKVLFKLVNGQACPGNGNKAPPAPKPKKVPQERPVYNIPEGTSPEEAKKMKKRQKRERQKVRKEQEKLDEQHREQMKQVEIQKRKEFLKQQENHIKKQQAALERQQKELLRQQTKAQVESKKKRGKKGKGNEPQLKDLGKKGKNASTFLYDGDDVARNFSLPPGVSINKVAGQPGMVTISNTMGSPGYSQPFLPNPNLYQNNLIPGFSISGHNPLGYPMGSNSMGYSGMYRGCGSSIPWAGGIDPCTGTPQESVIVVDTNSGITNSGITNSKGTRERKPKAPKASLPPPKTFATSEEKIEAAVRGELDPSLLNQTQKQKYKKCLKAIREEEENALLKQREEDELMDRMYELSKGHIPSKHAQSKNQTTKKDNSKDASKISSKSSSGSSSLKQSHQVPARNDNSQNKKQKQNSAVHSSIHNSQSGSKAKNQNTAANKKGDSKQNSKAEKDSKSQQSQLKQKLQQKPQQENQNHKNAQSQQASGKKTSTQAQTKQQQEQTTQGKKQKQTQQQAVQQTQQQKSQKQNQQNQKQQQPQRQQQQQQQKSPKQQQQTQNQQQQTQKLQKPQQQAQNHQKQQQQTQKQQNQQQQIQNQQKQQQPTSKQQQQTSKQQQQTSKQQQQTSKQQQLTPKQQQQTSKQQQQQQPSKQQQQTSKQQQQTSKQQQPTSKQQQSKQQQQTSKQQQQTPKQQQQTPKQQQQTPKQQQQTPKQQQQTPKQQQQTPKQQQQTSKQQQQTSKQQQQTPKQQQQTPKQQQQTPKQQQQTPKQQQQTPKQQQQTPKQQQQTPKQQQAVTKQQQQTQKLQQQAPKQQQLTIKQQTQKQQQPQKQQPQLQKQQPQLQKQQPQLQKQQPQLQKQQPQLQKQQPQLQKQQSHLQKQQQQPQKQQKQYLASSHLHEQWQGNHAMNQLASTNFNAMRLQQAGFKGSTRRPGDPGAPVYSSQLPYEMNSYGNAVGYANNDYGHEARYAQYLAANASALASVEYEASNYVSSQTDCADDKSRRKKKGKRGHLEDMTIDSVFTPKELPSGELDDETDREVEAFKRFCLYNVPRCSGEKPKVNINVKDILIKKKH